MCIIAEQYNCDMLVYTCIVVHFYYIRYVSKIESSISTLSMPVYAYMFVVLIDAFEKYMLC